MATSCLVLLLPAALALGAPDRAVPRPPASRPQRAAAPSDLTQAPPPFSLPNGRAIFSDIEQVDVDLEFDVPTQRATVTAKIALRVADRGRPIFCLGPQAKRVHISSPTETVEADLLTVQDPDQQTSWRVVDHEVRRGAYDLVVAYELPRSDALRFDGGGVDFFTAATDLVPGAYAQQYFPTNAEYDQLALVVRIAIRGATRAHRVLANGEVAREGDSWTISFPSYFNTASVFLDIVDPARVTVLEESYPGKEGAIPVTVYAEDADHAAEALERVMSLFPKVERAIGPFPHARFLAKVVGRYNMDSMEYAGATMTGVTLIHHEMFHSWYARGVMPADGNALWIDEALAHWFDRGCPRLSKVDTEAQLAGWSPYRSHMDQAPYLHGSNVIAHLDYVFAELGVPEGLRPALQEFFLLHRRETVTSQMFEEFLAARVHTPEAVRRIFRTHVYQPRSGLWSELTLELKTQTSKGLLFFNLLDGWDYL